MKRGGIALLLLAGSVAFLASCKTDEDVVPATTTTTPGSTTQPAPSTDLAVNKWILESLQTYYYWNDKLPANPNLSQAPEQFFLSLLYDRNNTANLQRDRFSWIDASATELVASLNGESLSTGIEFKVFLRTSGGEDVIGKVLYVLPNSPAQRAGIKRGDFFYQVNGQRLTRANYGNLLYGNVSAYTFGMLAISNNQLVDSNVTRQLTATVLQEDPVYLDSVYTIGAKKIGYIVYNQFVPGPNGSNSTAYDQKLDNIFGKFKAQGVNELVLDLRYNPGGYVSSASKLASLIVKGAKAGDVFAEKRWNPILTAELKKQSNSDGYFYDRFVTKANNIGANLSRVYVLTTDGTASASELIINGLKPYMTVNTIGGTTYGKNVGSITLSDAPAGTKWGMQPIVSRSFNKVGQSDYWQGFTPTVAASEPLVLKPLGDLSETFLNEAIFQISGTRTARRAAEVQMTTEAIGSSISRKAGGSNMFSPAPVR
jgi:carboxyl-terminal processing protease